MALPLQRSARWLFIGDSITDCRRLDCPDEIGQGYVRLVRDWLLARDAVHAPSVVNRGVSGDTVLHLEGRWHRDVVALHPDLVSIKIGINDVWHGLSRNGGPLVPLETFTRTYEGLLDQLAAEWPAATVVLCEPTVISPPAAENGNAVLRDFVQAVRDLGESRKLPVVPLHETFLRARQERPDIAWAPDGVHPGSAGHMLIARTWLAALGLL